VSLFELEKKLFYGFWIGMIMENAEKLDFQHTLSTLQINVGTRPNSDRPFMVI
jgi:hypothetical protein